MTTVRRLPAILVASAAIVGLSSGTAAAGPEPQDQVVLSGTALVPRGVEVGEVVVLHGTARIAGVAHGDVIVVDGPAVVIGQVSGSVIAVGGRVTLGPGAQVGGDVRAGGLVRLAGTAKVGGTVRQRVAFSWRTPVEVVGPFASWLAVSVSTLILGLLFVLLLPRALDAVASAERGAPWPSVGWGLVVSVGVPVASVLALASLVALPLGLATLLAFAFAALAAYALSAYAIGRGLWAAPRNRALAFGFGWVILRAIGLIPFVSGVTFGLVAAYGAGAAVVATWRARDTAGRHREGRRAQVARPQTIGEQAGL